MGHPRELDDRPVARVGLGGVGRVLIGLCGVAVALIGAVLALFGLSAAGMPTADSTIMAVVGIGGGLTLLVLGVRVTAGVIRRGG